jgi:hypothetical protein
MSNSLRGAIPFTVDGQDFFLRITTNGQVRYEDATGESYFRGVAALQRDPSSVKRIRALAFAGLSHVPGMTLDKVGEMIDALGVVQMASIVGKAIAAASPEVAEGNVETPPKKPRAA